MIEHRKHPADERVVFPVTGESVEQVRFDFCVGLEVDANDGGDRFSIRISCPFQLLSSDGTRIIDPEALADGADVLAVLALFKKVVVSADADPDGRLKIMFTHGVILLVEPDDHYEAWQVWRTNRFVAVCLPGGGLAVWNGR